MQEMGQSTKKRFKNLQALKKNMIGCGSVLHALLSIRIKKDKKHNTFLLHLKTLVAHNHFMPDKLNARTEMR
jgi:hypothetical protein